MKRIGTAATGGIAGEAVENRRDPGTGILCLGALLARRARPDDHLGETLPDFTVETIDGGTFTLSEALKEKDLVMINLWATWCGPCEREFPYMEEAYELYSDKVEIIALSVEPDDYSRS